MREYAEINICLFVHLPRGWEYTVEPAAHHLAGHLQIPKCATETAPDSDVREKPPLKFPKHNR